MRNSTGEPDMARRKSPEENLQDLEEQKRQLEARIRQERKRAQKAERERATRRQMLIGGKVLEYAQSDSTLAQYVRKIYHDLSERDQRVFEGVAFPEPEPEARDHGREESAPSSGPEDRTSSSDESNQSEVQRTRPHVSNLRG